MRLAAVWTLARLSRGSIGAFSSGPSTTVTLASPLLSAAVLPYEGEELFTVHVVEAFLLLLRFRG